MWLKRRTPRRFRLAANYPCSSEGFRRILENVRVKFGFGELTLAIPYHVAHAELAALLNEDKSLSLIKCERSEDALEQYSERVGYLKPDAGTWELPPRCATCIVFLGDYGQVGVRMTYEVTRRGVKTIIFPDVLEDWLGRNARWYLTTATIASGWRRLSALGLSLITRHRIVQKRLAADRGLRRVLERRYKSAYTEVAVWLKQTVPAEQAVITNSLVIVSASLGGGGAERQVVNTATGLATQGEFDVSVLCERLEGGARDFFVADLDRAGVPVRCVSDLSEPSASAELLLIFERLQPVLEVVPYWIAEGILGYVAAFLKLRPRIVHAWQDETNIKAGIAAAAVGVPLIVLSGRSFAPIHFALYQPYMRGGYRLLASLARTRILNNSRAGALDYSCWLGCDTSKITVLHNGLMMDILGSPPAEEVRRWSAEVGITETTPVIGTVLRFFEEKGPLLWVRTAAMIAQLQPEARFLMVGDGPLLDKTRRLAESLGIGDRLITPGRMKRPSIPLAVMDVFLLTSRMEGLPNVLLEAQAVGVPVVTTDAGGAAETIEPGVTGWAVSPHVPDKLGERVLEVLTNSEWRDRARRRAPEFMQERYGLDRMIEETIAVYRSGDRFSER